MSAFVVAAAVLVALLFAAAFTVARAEDATLDRAKVHAQTIKRWGGGLLMAVGVWFLILAIFADRFERVFPV